MLASLFQRGYYSAGAGFRKPVLKTSSGGRGKSELRNMHKYEELFPDEFKAEIERSPIIYLAFAPIEYHGRHGGLGMDLLKGYDICLRAAEISGGVVYPAVPAAPEGKQLMSRDELRAAARLYSPGVFISAGACERLYNELLEVFAEDIGFRVCVIMGSHAPAGKLARKIAGGRARVKGMKILAAGSMTHNRDVLNEEYGRLGIARVNHGGMWESAMLMAVSPESVDPEKIRNAPLDPDSMHAKEKYGAYQIPLPAYEEISKVSVEFGERLLQAAAERIAAEALELLG